MSGIYDLTGKNIENTYQRVLQTPDGTTFYDGTGSLVTLPSANTASLLTTASATGNTITFTKGDGSTFPVTVTGGTGNTATGSYGSFYSTVTQTNPIGNVPRSMSFNTTDISNGVSISGSINPFNTYIKVQNAGVYDIQFSAQLDKTDSGTDEILIWLRKNDIDITDTATTISLVGNNAKNVAAWNFFVNAAANDYYQLIWYSPDVDLRLLAEVSGGGHPGIPSVILTVNRVDQFLSNTGSFTGSFTGNLIGTASYALNAPSISPGGGDTSIQFNSSSKFGGSSALAYQFNTTSSDAFKLSHTSNYNLITTPYNNSFPASIQLTNISNNEKQIAGLSHYQYNLAAPGTSTIYSFNVNGLKISGFKCDYCIMSRKAGVSIASRTGTLYGAWSNDSSILPVITDNYVNGDQVYSELQTVVFTLVWNGSDEIDLQMDCSVISGNIYFNGLFTNFGNTL